MSTMYCTIKETYTESLANLSKVCFNIFTEHMAETPLLLVVSKLVVLPTVMHSVDFGRQELNHLVTYVQFLSEDLRCTHILG